MSQNEALCRSGIIPIEFVGFMTLINGISVSVYTSIVLTHVTHTAKSP